MVLQVQTLQATRRKEEKGTKDNQLTVPVKRQSGTLADIAEVIHLSASQLECCGARSAWAA